jgi:hypothetical protein
VVAALEGVDTPALSLELVDACVDAGVGAGQQRG